MALVVALETIWISAGVVLGCALQGYGESSSPPPDRICTEGNSPVVPVLLLTYIPPALLVAGFVLGLQWGKTIRRRSVETAFALAMVNLFLVFVVYRL